MLGESNAMKRVWRCVELVAPTDMTVLVLGETGTGKELTARALHAKSARRDRPLINVNCWALPGELIESELFGHERGAFTGAATRQVGRFELAHGATIFLDEIGDLPLRLQAKLLRVLQEGEFERLGNPRTIGVDTRVIAATNRDLLEAVGKGSFRADLYYRLNVYPINLPPLRERREDIPLLAQNFLGETQRGLGRDFGDIPRDVADALQLYDWPGNIRELQNVIQRAAVTSTTARLRLPEGWRAPPANERPGAMRLAEDASRSIQTGAKSGSSLDDVARKHIVRALQQTDWRIEGPRGAAVILGLKPSTLRLRMQKLRIQKVSAENQRGSVRRKPTET
jgi:formate hydrogenlyase transcriptional activator